MWAPPPSRTGALLIYVADVDRKHSDSSTYILRVHRIKKEMMLWVVAVRIARVCLRVIGLTYLVAQPAPQSQ
jgi:hypothetical protein